MTPVCNAVISNQALWLIHPGGSYTKTRLHYDLWHNDKRLTFPTWSKRNEYISRYPGETYEGDVHPIRRYFVDHPDIVIGAPASCYLDIESDSRASFKQQTSGSARVLCWTVKGHLGTRHGMLSEDTDHDEGALLAGLWDALKPYDRVLAWNGGMVERDILESQDARHGYDFYVILRRAQRLGVLPSWWKRMLFLDHLECFKKHNLNTGDANEKTSYSLENIGMSRVGRGKTGFDSKRCWEFWRAGGTQRKQLGDYNIGDVELEEDIEKASGYVKVFDTLCKLTKCFPDTVNLQPMPQVDGLMLAYADRRGLRFRTVEHGAPKHEGKFPGAFVDGPYVRGIEKDIHVADFKSLYPSIMISLNISPETLGGTGITAPVDQESLDKMGVAQPITFSAEEGVMTECLRDMARLREESRTKAKQYPVGSPEERDYSAQSMAYKVATNSFYGVLCSVYSRYFDVRLGLATTRTGVTLIKAAQEAVRKRGWSVIYTDTDSLFVRGPKSNDEFKAFVRECNETLFPALVKSWGCQTNTVLLDYEKAFSRVLFAYDSKKQRYTRKKYVYKLAHKGFVEPKKPIGATGVELRRGDSSALARELLERSVELLLSDCTADELLNVIQDARVNVLHTPHPVEHVALSKSISKDLSQYDGDLPHIKAAKLMEKRGYEVRESTKIQYVVTCGSKSNPKYDGTQRVCLLEDYQDNADMYYLWENSVYPPTYRLAKAAFPHEKRFDDYCAPSGKALGYTRVERAGQMRLAI